MCFDTCLIQSDKLSAKLSHSELYHLMAYIVST